MKYIAYFNIEMFGETEPEFEGTEEECNEFVKEEVNSMAKNDFNNGIFPTLEESLQFSSKFYTVKEAK